jgi:Transposase DNA-binding/Transposase Tn5 dimerisation domain
MSWVESEFETLDIGDIRLNRRAISIAEGLGLAPGRSIPQTFVTRSEVKACYKFFDNDLVSDEKLLRPHIDKTIERIKEYPVVLLPSDTSELDYTTKKAMVGKERITNKKSGLWLHATIAVTPERLTLGVVDANFWSREPEVAEDDSAYRNARDKAPIEEKESYRWLQSYLRACQIAREVPEVQIINITDREGDIIEFFEAAAEEKKKGASADFIIRSQYDRLLLEENSETHKAYKKLKQTLMETASLGELEFTIPPTEKRKGRKVKQQLKAAEVILKPSNKKVAVKVNAVMAIEEAPPEGEKPLIWVFITNLPINTFEDISNIISYYLCRWEIELFFKVLKSGCKIEERQLQTADRMKALLSIFMVLSWRVMFTMMLGRVCSEMSCSDLFEAAEWKSVFKILNKKKAIPKKPPKLGDFIVMIAILGGYVATKSAEPPGVKTMWKGMARMIDFAIAWDAFGG